MKIEDYPSQEPFTAIGERYPTEVMQRAGNASPMECSFGADPYQSVSIFPAPDPDGNVLCVMHGGGWTNGYKEWMAFMAPALTSKGVTFVSIGYRLAPKHIFPAGFDDCCDAVALIYREISNWGGDPNRIFIGGHSAGGHYASLLALRQDWQDPRGLPEDIIKAALPISGTYEFGENSGLSMRPRFLGPEGNGAGALASPNSYIHRGAPPFLVSYGDADFPHLVQQADKFVQGLVDSGIDASVVKIRDCDHLGASYASGEPNGDWCNSALEFIRRV